MSLKRLGGKNRGVHFDDKNTLVALNLLADNEFCVSPQPNRIPEKSRPLPLVVQYVSPLPTKLFSSPMPVGNHGEVDLNPSPKNQR